MYVEPFFGAGGMFFNKPQVEYNILNDLDSDVFNLFQIIKNNPEKLLEKLEITPYHQDVFSEFKKSKETCIYWKAFRFIYLSNFGYMGKPDTLSFYAGNNKKIALKNYQKTIDFLKDCSLQFTNNDFRKALKQFAFRSQKEIDSAFIYCDPPYLGTNDNYSNSFTEQDSIDLFDCLQATGCKFAMSEFDNEFILNQAKERGLNVIIIGERVNMKNRRTEILITNYENNQQKLF
jgi:DNA adenine methylase